MVRFTQVIASISRIFLDERMHWTLQATCAVCLAETLGPLLMGIPIRCGGCEAVIKIDPSRTVFHRSEGTGHAREPAIPRRAASAS